jgi:hypothetical protein
MQGSRRRVFQGRDTHKRKKSSNAETGETSIKENRRGNRGRSAVKVNGA